MSLAATPEFDEGFDTAQIQKLPTAEGGGEAGAVAEGGEAGAADASADVGAAGAADGAGKHNDGEAFLGFPPPQMPVGLDADGSPLPYQSALPEQNE